MKITDFGFNADLDQQFRVLGDALSLPYLRRTEVRGAYTIAKDDYYIALYSSIGAFSIQLPKAADFKGRALEFLDEAGVCGSKNVTLVPQNLEKINGASSYVINSNYGKVKIFSNGSNWFVAV